MRSAAVDVNLARAQKENQVTVRGVTPAQTTTSQMMTFQGSLSKLHSTEKRQASMARQVAKVITANNS